MAIEIKKESDFREINFKSSNGFYAEVKIHTLPSQESDTTIYIQDNMDYIWLESEYDHILTDEEIFEIVTKGFEKAEKMQHSPAKYGEHIPTIED